MTKAYERLQEEPLTKFDAYLNPEERAELRRIKVTGMHGHRLEGSPGQLTTVYFLEGDEARAARKFVEENREQLEQMDFGRKNLLKESLSQEIFDLILHHLGERRRRKYSTVVLETRPDGTRWLIDRSLYDEYPIRRYSAGAGSARLDPEVDLEELFESAPEIITEDVVESWPIDGDVKQVLDYFRLSSDFPCGPIVTEGDERMAVRKDTS